MDSRIINININITLQNNGCSPTHQVNFTLFIPKDIIIDTELLTKYNTINN